MLSQSEILPADTVPLGRHQEDSAAPKRDRRQYLTKVDRRSRLGIRIRELTEMYIVALGGELSPLKREAIGDAAQLKALSEDQRGAWMRGEAKCSLDDLVRLERRADQAVRALRIVARPRAREPSLIERLRAGSTAP